MDEFAGLTEGTRKLALNRFRFLQPHLEQNLGEKTPSYGTVFNVVRALPAGLITLAHDGAKAYSERFDSTARG
jgi:hypothetical protein